SELGGGTIGVVSLNSIASLELRYLLQEAYGLEPGGADELLSVTLVESPAESLPDLLVEGELEAGLTSPQGAFGLRNDDAVRVLADVTTEVRDLTGGPIAHSILLTYPDVAGQKSAGLVELNRMLMESMSYFRANQDPVIVALGEQLDVEPGFMRWWWDRYELLMGELTQDAQDQIVNIWEVAFAVGDIEEVPEIASLLFQPADLDPEVDGDRTTVSIAVLDDPGRRAALYAIEQGIVTSSAIDLDISYLAQTALTEAAAAKQYDVVEASPLAVPLSVERDLDFLILSAALQNLDGTLLFVRDGDG
ncbi:MAG: hypothetical protein WD939_07375, partial [Dehalococcoidia bacterium]